MMEQILERPESWKSARKHVEIFLSAAEE